VNPTLKVEKKHRLGGVFLYSYVVSNLRTYGLYIVLKFFQHCPRLLNILALRFIESQRASQRFGDPTLKDILLQVR
jgi:hypothetical protein